MSLRDHLAKIVFEIIGIRKFDYQLKYCKPVIHRSSKDNTGLVNDFDQMIQLEFGRQ